MPRLIFIGISVLVCLLFFIAGWFLGRADHIAQSNSFAAQAAIILATNLEKKRTPIPDQIFTQIDAAVQSMDSVLPLVIDTKKREQIQKTYIQVAEFKDKHPAWVQYYDGSIWPMEKDDTINKRVDAILSQARKSP